MVDFVFLCECLTVLRFVVCVLASMICLVRVIVVLSVWCGCFGDFGWFAM